MDAQSAALYGQQSSQPSGFPGGAQKSGGNEDLALALAAMASGGAASNAVLGGGLSAETATPSLQNSMVGTSTGSPAGSVSSIFGNVNTGLGAVKTGTQLWDAGSKLYNALFGGTDWSGISTAGSALTSSNLASELSSTAPNLLDSYDWWTWM